MWLLYALGSLIFNAAETTVDKVALVSSKTIDALSGTFLRVFLFCFYFGVGGAIGFLGTLRIFAPWPIIGIGIICAGSSLVYTYLLKRLEATGYTALSYLGPLLYLIIDTQFLKFRLTPFEVLGVLLLTAGGVMFVINPGQLKFKKEFTPIVFIMLAYNFFINAAQNYGFKYYYETRGLNEVSFYFNVWTIALIVLLGVMLASNKLGSLWHTVNGNQRFVKTIAVSKLFDAGNSWLWLHALALVTVSQVNATDAIYPLIMIGVVYIVQNVFKLKVEEKLSQGYLGFKLAAVGLLCLGGFLVK